MNTCQLKELKKSDRHGLIQVYTGDGKGKTTAATGLAVRAAGAGLKTAIVYFDKGGEHYSERKIFANELKEHVEFFPTGLDRIDPDTKEFRFGVTAEDKAEAERGLNIAETLLVGEAVDVVILDEVLNVVALEMAPEEALLKLIRLKPPTVELVLTGRHVTSAVAELADLISEIKPVKHYLSQGILAREGLDF